MGKNRYRFSHINISVTQLFFVALLSCLSASSSFAADKKHVRLALQWSPQAQFAGYYMAQEKGIYDSNGLDVEILPGTTSMNGCEKVRQGQAEFGTAFLSDGLQQRSEGVPFVNIGQFIQRSALMLVTRKDSGIKTIRTKDR
jgi:NitT/TauT family transport system substrate-binding protein